MPILKKKEKIKTRKTNKGNRTGGKSGLFKQKKATDSGLKKKVYMPQRNTTGSSRRQKKGFNPFSIFSKSKSKFGGRNTRRRRIMINMSKIFFYLLIPLIFVSFMYISVRYILNTRGLGESKETESEYVIGIEGVPAYPKSQFMFENNVNDVSVANFIGSGNSAYRLPLNKTVSQAHDYYNETLPELGWEHVLSVNVGSEEMKHGEYWVKGNRALRIYSKFSDLWYELVTVEQANTGLRDRVEEEIERDLLLATDDYQELLPDFPWKVKIPKEFIISYSVSDYEDLRSVEFRRIGSSERVIITPVGSIGDVLDNYLIEYVDNLNQSESPASLEEQEASTDATLQVWTISNTVLSYTSYARALKGTIVGNGETHDVAVVQNLYDSVVYVIHSNSPEEPLFEYVLENMEPQGMGR